MAERFQFSIRSILSTTIGVACVVAAVHCFGPLATAEGALCGGMAGSMFGLAAGTLKHGVVIGDRFSDQPKYGALFGAIVGSWALQFVTGLLELALIALAAITVIIAAVMATVRRN